MPCKKVGGACMPHLLIIFAFAWVTSLADARVKYCKFFCEILSLFHVYGLLKVAFHDTDMSREDPGEDIARVGRKDVGVSGESVSVSGSMSVSWNVAFTNAVLSALFRLATGA